jgi:hypothetical protein
MHAMKAMEHSNMIVAIKARPINQRERDLG